MHRTVRVWRQAPAMRASRQWAPVFLRTAGGTGVRGDAEQSPSIEDARRRPRARSQRPRCSTGGCGTTCCTKDTGPSRADPTRQAAVRIAVSRLAHALDRPLRKGRPGRPRTRQIGRSDAEFLRKSRDAFVLFFSPLRSASIGTGSSRDGHPTRPRTTAHRRGAGTRAGRRVLMTQTRNTLNETHTMSAPAGAIRARSDGTPTSD